jgi:hypothetical protein
VGNEKACHPQRRAAASAIRASCVPFALVDNIVKLETADTRWRPSHGRKGRKSMRVILAATALIVGQLLGGGSPAFSQQPRVLLTPEQTRAYHECMTAAWVQEYCRSHAWGIFGRYDRTEAECVAANRGNIFSLNDRRLYENTEGYCWNQAHNISH